MLFEQRLIALSLYQVRDLLQWIVVILLSLKPIALHVIQLGLLLLLLQLDILEFRRGKQLLSELLRLKG